MATTPNARQVEDAIVSEAADPTAGQLPVASGTGKEITWTDPGTAVLNNVSSITFDTAAGVSVSEGEIAWNATDQTLDMGTSGGTTVQIGQEVLIRVLNDTGSAFADGDVVYITGAQGNRVTAALAQADSVSGNSTIGVVTQPIPDNQEGFITVLGLVRDFDTSAWLEGDELWLSASVAGEITNVMPSLPNSAISIGFVSRSHASVGSIFVRVIRGVASVTGDTNITIAGAPNSPQVTLDSVQTFTNFSLNTTDVSGTPNIIAANSQGVVDWNHDGVNTSVSLQHNGSDVLTVDETGCLIDARNATDDTLNLIGNVLGQGVYLGSAAYSGAAFSINFSTLTFTSGDPTVSTNRTGQLTNQSVPGLEGGTDILTFSNHNDTTGYHFNIGNNGTVASNFSIGDTASADSSAVAFRIRVRTDNVTEQAWFGATPVAQPVLTTGTPEEVITAIGSTSGLGLVDDSAVVFDTVIDPVAGADDDNKDVFPPENPQRHNTIKFDTTGGAQTAHMETGTWLPGDTVRFVDYASNFTTANLTIDFETHNFEGVAAQTLVMSVDDGAVTIEYIDSTRGFQRISVV